MAFTYNLTTYVGKVRFEIGDRVVGSGVRPDSTNFSDEEIEAILAETSNDVLLASSRLMEVLSREWARVADFTLGPRKESLSQISKQFATLAAKLRERAGGDVMSSTTGFVRRDGYSESVNVANGVEYSITHFYPWPWPRPPRV